MKKLGIWLKMLYLCITGKGKLVFIELNNNHPAVYSDVYKHAYPILNDYFKWRLGYHDTMPKVEDITFALKIAKQCLVEKIVEIKKK